MSCRVFPAVFSFLFGLGVTKATFYRFAVVLFSWEALPTPPKRSVATSGKRRVDAQLACPFAEVNWKDARGGGGKAVS